MKLHVMPAEGSLQ